MDLVDCRIVGVSIHLKFCCLVNQGAVLDQAFGNIWEGFLAVVLGCVEIPFKFFEVSLTLIPWVEMLNVGWVLVRCLLIIMIMVVIWFWFWIRGEPCRIKPLQCFRGATRPR